MSTTLRAIFLAITLFMAAPTMANPFAPVRLVKDTPAAMLEAGWVKVDETTYTLTAENGVAIRKKAGATMWMEIVQIRQDEPADPSATSPK